jgi:hypothetical protein
MTFYLSPSFKKRVDEIDAQLTTFESSHNRIEQKRALRTALVNSCALLSSLDVQELRLEIDRIYRKAGNWTEIISQDSHFEYFLSMAEGKLLENMKLSVKSRARILNNLRKVKAQFTTKEIIAKRESTEIVKCIEDLKADICHEANTLDVDKDLTVEELTETGRKVSKVFGVVAIAADVVAPLFHPTMTPAGAAASIAVGHLAQLLK